MLTPVDRPVRYPMCGRAYYGWEVVECPHYYIPIPTKP